MLTPLALSVSIVGGWILSGVVLRPLGRIADQANRITAERLNERIPERDIDDELGRLIRSFNIMVGRLQSSFDEMRQFSADAAHELKTPLTILKGEAEMSLADAESTDEGRHLATTVLEETARISHIVDDLLTLARADAGVADDGIGIVAQDLDRIFDRFYRASEARAQRARERPGSVHRPLDRRVPRRIDLRGQPTRPWQHVYRASSEKMTLALSYPDSRGPST